MGVVEGATGLPVGLHFDFAHLRAANFHQALNVAQALRRRERLAIEAAQQVLIAVFGAPRVGAQPASDTSQSVGKATQPLIDNLDDLPRVPVVKMIRPFDESTL